MKILILEDDPFRIDMFRTKFKQDVLYITKNPQEAVEWLKETDFNYIFLDCDLADDHYDRQEWYDPEYRGFDDTSGVFVGNFLEQNCDINKGATIIVHSMNPNGAERIFKGCKGREAYLIPYNDLWNRVKIT